MKNNSATEINDRAHYDRLQLLRLNNIAYSQGLINKEKKDAIETKI